VDRVDRVDLVDRVGAENRRFCPKAASSGHLLARRAPDWRNQEK
jgi:hypothetical protein